jgi:lysine-N-methylase
MYIYLDLFKEYPEEAFTCERCGTCCRNDWLVTLDEASYQRNAQWFMKTGRSEEFQNAFVLRNGNNGLDEYAHIAKQSGGGCWFLDETNRCRLHREAGHNHLDTVCQTFPRYPMSTARGIELTLSFSCPAVIKMASRIAPLEIIRSEQPPVVINPDTYVLQVYPQQQPVNNPLRYYFEIEHHFIDVLQYRSMTMEERLLFVKGTVEAISCLPQDDLLSQQLNQIFYKNYDIMDTKKAMAVKQEQSAGDSLIENFFVSFIFKKPFYLYGLQRTMELLQRIWQQIKYVRENSADLANDWERTRSIVMEMEFQYSHNRQSLLSRADYSHTNLLACKK